MFDFIKANYKGDNIVIAITGLPITLTGEVMETENNTIGLRLKGGNKVYIDADLIAFVY